MPVITRFFGIVIKMNMWNTKLFRKLEGLQ